MTTGWTDWLTDGFFRIHVSRTAARKLGALPPRDQERLRQMLYDITSLIDVLPPGAPRSWRDRGKPALLELQLGRVSVRYFIDEASRTLTVEHVIIPERRGLHRVG
jgi:hypothetical protein